MGRNLHKYYYRDYFGEQPEEIKDSDNRQDRGRTVSLDWNNIKSKENASILKKRNARLTGAGLLNVIENPTDTKDTFQLKIIYPGLVTGIGINHEATIEGEFKLGVHFDWTHGMPVVYGSSVKGVLRDAFENGYVDASLIAHANSRADISETDKVPDWVGDSAMNKDLVNDIFKGEGKSIYGRDIFFDAVLTCADSKNRILVADSITPHTEGPLKDPTPITFLKIAPGCTIEFRFKLTDSMINDKMFTASQKKTLFREILTTVGIGAKTNVGYGQLK